MPVKYANGDLVDSPGKKRHREEFLVSKKKKKSSQHLQAIKPLDKGLFCPARRKHLPF